MFLLPRSFFFCAPNSLLPPFCAHSSSLLFFPAVFSLPQFVFFVGLLLNSLLVGRHKLWISILVPSLRLLHWLSVSIYSAIEVSVLTPLALDICQNCVNGLRIDDIVVVWCWRLKTKFFRKKKLLPRVCQGTKMESAEEGVLPRAPAEER